MEFDLENISKHYFSNINVLAKKIATDIENTREAYQDFWHSLSKKEQEQVIDENIINPSAVIKYGSLQITTTKENPNIYSWFTKSQLDLYDQSNAIKQTKCIPSGKSVHHVKINKASEEIERLINLNKDSMQIEKQLTNPNKLQHCGPHKTFVLKPKTPPPPPPPPSLKNTMISFTETNSTYNDNISKSESHDLPKTGFDFLDNW